MNFIFIKICSNMIRTERREGCGQLRCFSGGFELVSARHDREALRRHGSRCYIDRIRILGHIE